MNALTIITPTGLPPARRALVDLNRRIRDGERHLSVMQSGRDRLRSELGRADSARNELDAMVSEDATSLAGKLRSGANWMLSNFGSARAMNLVAALAESQLQHNVGQKALAEIEAEISAAEREVSDLKARLPDVVRNVLLESAAGFRDDFAEAIEQLRNAMVALSALDKITARNDGSWAPNERIVVETPAIGGRPAQAVVAPSASIENAQKVWAKYAQALSENPLASADEMKFPDVDPHADDGLVEYSRLSKTERSMVDQNRANGVN